MSGNIQFISSSLLRPVLPHQEPGSRSFNFLRRFVSRSRLPTSLEEAFEREESTMTYILIPPPLPQSRASIVGAISPHVMDAGALSVVETQIPLFPPNSAEQAVAWSQTYWPCLFNPAAQPLQAAPSLQMLRVVTAELDQQRNLSLYFEHARLKAIESYSGKIGRNLAAVVVNPSTRQMIAVAGDARYSDDSGISILHTISENGKVDGRPQKHALMQAIALVAEAERRRKESEELPDPGSGRDWSLQADSGAPAIDNSGQGNPDSYLCQGLDIYLTHEPCVACAMAMVHSRFRACIFERRMPDSGAIFAEKVRYEQRPGETKDSLGYGLFWRKELNWRVLAFQYFPSGASTDHVGDGPDEQCPALEFHA